MPLSPLHNPVCFLTDPQFTLEGIKLFPLCFLWED